MRNEIPVIWAECPDGVPPKLFAASFSVRHGSSITNDDRRDVARQTYTDNPEFSQVEAAKFLGVSQSRLSGWVSDITEGRRLLRVAKALLLSNIGWTQQRIADELGISRPSIVSFINGDISDISADLMHRAAGEIAQHLDGINVDLLIDNIVYADEESEAKTYLEKNGAQDVLAQVGSKYDNHREAKAVWLEKNRKEKAKLEREKREHEEAINRDANRIRAFLSGYDGAYSMREHQHRDEVLQALTSADRKRFQRIESETTWPTNRI